ncbi:hypothetical protein MAR_002748 [Mya arenaria]|uniref:Uncharacterized protein n=1 Tax=Mya arenaria TaxID=6604 RepID=A0ABY7G409_MYAAR|nr:hypothetical protein MAR_002748 [Mya arenaria]
MVWKRSLSPPPKKARISKSAKKFMFIFFMDSAGMLLQHAVPADSTVNAAYYQKIMFQTYHSGHIYRSCARTFRTALV